LLVDDESSDVDDNVYDDDGNLLPEVHEAREIEKTIHSNSKKKRHRNPPFVVQKSPVTAIPSLGRSDYLGMTYWRAK